MNSFDMKECARTLFLFEMARVINIFVSFILIYLCHIPQRASRVCSVIIAYLVYLFLLDNGVKIRRHSLVNVLLADIILFIYTYLSNEIILVRTSIYRRVCLFACLLVSLIIRLVDCGTQ